MEINSSNIQLRRLQRTLEKFLPIVSEGAKLTQREAHQAWFAMKLGGKEEVTLTGLYGHVLELTGFKVDSGDDVDTDDNLRTRNSGGESDAVAEATDIVRRASTGGIDWSREPLDERERKIRAKILEGKHWIELECIANYVRPHIASDLAQALKQAGEDLRAGDRERQRREAEDAAREVDGLPPLDDDDTDDDTYDDL